MSLFKRKSKDTGNDVYAFISGNTIPITEVNDPVFSAKTLGDGLAIILPGNLSVHLAPELSLWLPKGQIMRSA